MEFRNKYNRVITFTEHGSPIKDVMAAKMDKNHNMVIEKKGEDNLYAYINSFADSVDINVLLNRFTNGDREALLQRAGGYIDISSMPDNVNDFIAYTQSASSLFDTLPVEVKQQFNNNVLEFITTAGEEQWVEAMNTSQYEIMKNKDAETKANSKQLQDIVNHAPEIIPSVLDDVTPIEEPITPIKETK